MKALKPVTIKRFGKQDRERKVLLGLIDHYLATGKPVGSNTLKEAGFGELSSATIRNYFAHLEEIGYLQQQHASGGRIPTDAAYRLYGNEYSDNQEIDPYAEENLHNLKANETREIALFLQQAAEKLSGLTNMAVFLSAPRFDHDFILDIKFIPIDHSRCLCIVITDFGLVQTELIHTEKKFSAFSAKRIETYFHWRLTGQEKPENLEPEEEQFSQRIYNELMVRYIVGYSNFTNEDLYRTGFSKLLGYADFSDGVTLANSLALFENPHSIRLLTKECIKTNKLRFWIGSDLASYTTTSPNCSVVVVPYYINQKPAGAAGILGPTRMPYRQLFGTLRYFSNCISESLTKSLYKFKISFRQPNEETIYLQQEESRLIGQSRPILIEDKST